MIRSIIETMAKSVFTTEGHASPNFYSPVTCAGLLLFAVVITAFGLLIALAGDDKGILFVQLSGILTVATARLAWTVGRTLR